MNKRIKIIKQIRKNAVPYSELVNLSSGDCVKISRIYFNALMVKGNVLEIEDEKYWQILKKYMQIEQMAAAIRKPTSSYPSYYLMAAEDVKYLIDISKEISKVAANILKSDVKTDELNARHEEIKKKFKNIKSSKR